MTQASCPESARVHALMDGELRSADADDLRAHLAGCAICQAELADIMQLDAMVRERGGAAPSLAWYRRRKVQLAGLALAAAAAAAIVVTLPRTRPPEAVALAPRRMTEARLAWPGAAQYRRYDVPRASEPPHEAIDLMAIARLEQRGDAHGVGVLELLNGERRQAAAYLERAGDGPGVLSDRAALALEAGQPVQALRLVDAALERDAWHGPARWNRALALRDLGLPRAAAIAFRAAAARNEAGWADEARQRADALDREVDAMQERFARINLASVDLVQGKITLTADDAHAMPGFARGILYDAIRSATTPAQLAQLQPLADAIDSADRDTAMADAIRRATSDLRPELSRQYADMIRALAVESGMVPPGDHDPVVPAGAARSQLLAALRAAHADDLLIGVLMKVTADRSVVDPGDVAELTRLTTASPDPWMQLLGAQQRAGAAIKADDLVGAEAILLAARTRCGEPHAPAFRCIRIGSALADVYLTWQRVPEAHAVLESTWQLARSTGEWILQSPVLEGLATLASIADDVEASGQSLVRAYMAEYVERLPASMVDGRCDRAAYGRLLEAQLLIDQLRFAEARRALSGPRCQAALDPARAVGLFLARAKLAYHDGSPDEVRALRADIARARAATTRPAELVAHDATEGLVALRVDRAAGEALLRRAIAGARVLPESLAQPHKFAAWSYSALVDAAARAGEGDHVLAVLAEEQGLALPARCVVGVAIQDDHRTIAVRDAAGRIRLHADAARRTTAIDAARFVPAELAAALQGCPVVDVIAEAPLHGRSRLLPEALAWRYLSRRARAVGPSPARTLVVTDVEPPPALELPRLASWTADAGERLAGSAATPSRVLSAIGRSGEAVIHAHGLVDGAQPDAAYLALSPEPDGRFALTTRAVRAATLASNPLVILAACRSSSAAPVVHDTWSLPTAFIYAGARGVIASTAPVPDAEAGAFFDAVRARIRAGAPIAAALRDERAAYRGDWVRDLIVFE